MTCECLYGYEMCGECRGAVAFDEACALADSAERIANGYRAEMVHMRTPGVAKVRIEVHTTEDGAKRLESLAGGTLAGIKVLAVERGTK